GAFDTHEVLVVVTPLGFVNVVPGQAFDAPPVIEAFASDSLQNVSLSIVNGSGTIMDSWPMTFDSYNATKRVNYYHLEWPNDCDSDGAYRLVVHGLVGTIPVAFPADVVLDGTAPVIEGSAPAPIHASYAKTSNFELGLDISDDGSGLGASNVSGLASITVSLASGLPGDGFSTGSVATHLFPAGTASATWAVNFTTLGGNGPRSFVVSVLDRAGNELSFNWTVTLDTYSPALSSPTPADGGWVAGGDSAVSFSVVELNGVAAWNATAAGADVLSFHVGGGGRHEVLLRPHASASNVSLVVWVVDPAGNNGTMELLLHVDREAPLVASRNVASGSALPADGFLRVVAADGNGSGVASVACRVDGGSWVDTEYSASGGYWFLFVNATSMAEGEHVLEVRVVDLVGHETVEQVPFVVRAPPVPWWELPWVVALLAGGVAGFAVVALHAKRSAIRLGLIRRRKLRELDEARKRLEAIPE
ncbi:MAG: hypothetical protein JW839_01120, partial [Candidatus Lokiarchaeota archaeon]|nr:hypothetical protein [Candidatus Lokiarchaeota archaeon]